MLSGVRKRSQKAGLPPGTAIYTGTKRTLKPTMTVAVYDAENYQEKQGSNLTDCLPSNIPDGSTVWIDMVGLSDATMINQVAERYQLHPLTIEDILSVEQRSKIDEYENYLFLTLKMINWHADKKNFSVDELSVVFGKGFIITFQEQKSDLFAPIHERLSSSAQQPLRKQGSDYLAYRLIDIVVDQYFVVLEALGDRIEKVEDVIISEPTKKNARALYKLKRQMLVLRKTIWPMREVINHLLKEDSNIISSYTHIYLRDVYEHTVQAVDTIDTFRDMLSNMLDVYVSSLTNRMNEIMKVLTIIATLFMPVTFIASIYGMNFRNMPELNYQYGYPTVLAVMACVIICMLYFFRRQKWW